MGHDTLQNHYNTNFAMIHHHHWSLTEMENMLPWEKNMYIDLLSQYLKSEEQKAKQRDNERAMWANKAKPVKPPRY